MRATTTSTAPAATTRSFSEWPETTRYRGAATVTLTGAGAFNATGNNGDNKLTGNGSANVLNGGDGNDWLGGGGGNDSLLGRDGNDTFVFDATDGTVSGGAGTDLLLFNGPFQILNLAGKAGSTYTGIEIIDLTGTGANNLMLDKQNVLDMSDTTDILYVRGSFGEHVTDTNVASEWSQGSNVTIDGVLYSHFTSGSAELYLQNGLFLWIT